MFANLTTDNSFVADDASYNTCSYFDPNDFCNLKVSTPDNFSILYMNSRSLCRHFYDIHDFVLSLNHSFSIYGFSETWFKEAPPQYVHMDNYQLIHSSRSDKTGGGAAMFVKNSLNFHVREDLMSSCEDFECVFIEIERVHSANSADHKNRLYRRFLRKDYHNRLTSVIRAAKKNYFAQKLDHNKASLKNIWREINSILGKNKRADLPCEFTNGEETLRDPPEIANSFNTHFSNIGASLANNIPSTNSHYTDFLHNPNSFSFFLTPTNFLEVIKISNDLKSSSSCGFDGINSSVIKSVISFISRPLAYIFNLTFTTGSFPSNLKVAKVIPVFKNGDKHNISNYRPISILPCFSKILERLFYNRLNTFISRFHLLSDSQFGFRAKHSTDMALIQFVDKVSTALNNKLSTVGVFVDLSKAFDTIDHSILLDKLNFYGIRGVALKWLSSYLDNGQQFTSFKNHKSPWQEIHHGVPQGSILGPLLFLLYINDLHSSSSLLSFTLFADDTTIAFSDSNPAKSLNIMNAELLKVSSWFKANKLSLNEHKTKFMLFSKSSHLSEDIPILRIDNNPILQVHSTNFLGVIIDDQLSWSEHISSITKTISRNTGVMSRLRAFLPPKSLVLLYNTLILPYLNYCNIIWAQVSKNKLHSLLTTQKRAIRICTLSHPREHTAPLFAQLHSLALADINKLHTGIFMYKFTHNLLPTSFRSFFTFVRDTYGYSTISHNKSHLYVPFTRSSFHVKTLRFFGPRLWNGLSQSIRSQSSVGRFKRAYKRALLSQDLT